MSKQVLPHWKFGILDGKSIYLPQGYVFYWGEKKSKLTNIEVIHSETLEMAQKIYNNKYNL